MGKSIVFANQKGGVGKTTTVASLGAYVAEEGKKVLAVDFDPQGNLSSSLGSNPDKPSIYSVMMGQTNVVSAIQQTTVVGLDIVRADMNLTAANVELIDQSNRERFLRNALEEVKGNYDYIFIDCPPSLGLLTINGLCAADEVVIPLQCEYFALEGLTQLLKTVKQIKKSYNSVLSVRGIIFTMYDSRTRLANEVVDEVTGYFKDKVFKTIVPRNIRLSEAPSHGVPISQYNPGCSGAKSYKRLAKEFISRG